MVRYKEKLIKVLEDFKNSSIEEIADEIVKISNSKHIVGCFSVKDIGEVYELGMTHQKRLKKGDTPWTGEQIGNAYLNADDNYKNINWEENEETI